MEKPGFLPENLGEKRGHTVGIPHFIKQVYSRCKSPATLSELEFYFLWISIMKTTCVLKSRIRDHWPLIAMKAPVNEENLNPVSCS